MARRSRIDSIAEQARIMAAAANPIVPPANVPLTSEEMTFFDSIIAEFAKSELTAHKLELVAILARTMSDLVREQQALKTDPSKKTVVGMHQNFVVSLRRSLSLHGRIPEQSVAPVVAKRRERAKAIERASPLAAAQVIDLLARSN